MRMVWQNPTDIRNLERVNPGQADCEMTDWKETAEWNVGETLELWNSV